MYKMVKNRQKLISKTHRNIPRIAYLFILIVITMQISLVSAAWEFDNVKSYNPGTKTATITNAFGLGETIAEVTLNSPQEVKVLPGNDVKVAEFTINNFNDYDDVFGTMEFYIYRSEIEVSKEFVYKYKTNEDISVDEYESQCSNRILGNGTNQEYNCKSIKTGSHIENQVVWNNLDEKAQLKSGIITIGIFTDVSEGERLEWIPNLFGERISEWAAFVGATRFEFNIDDQQTDVLRNTNWQSVLFNVGNTGPSSNFNLIGVSFNLSFEGTPTGFSVMLVGVNGTNYPNYTDILSSNTTVDVNQLTSGWYNISMPGYVLQSGTNYSIILNQSGDGANDIFLGYNNSGGDYNTSFPAFRSMNSANNGVIWKKTSSWFIAFQTWGELLGSSGVFSNLITPIDNKITVNTSINFTSNQSAGTSYDIINATYKIWDGDDNLFNETTVTVGSSNETTLQINDFTIDTYLWNVLVCGQNLTGTLCNSSASNFTLVVGINTTNLVFNNDTTEGNTENFKINVTILAGSTLTQANLIYNNTNFGGTFTSVGTDKYQIDKTISVPFVTADINKSFFFNFIFSDGASQNTSTKNQTIRNLGIDDCSSNNVTILNYTLRDEENQTILNGTLFNTNIEIDIDIFVKGTSTNSIINFSQSFDKTNPATICLLNNLSSTEFALFSTVKYFSNSRETEYHYLQNFSLTNSSIPQNISLFDLLSVDSESFAVTFKDNSLLPVENALINVQRQYVDEGLFKSVEIGKTDSNGRTILHLVRNDIVYTMIVTKDGRVLATFDNVIAFCDDFTIGDCKISLNQESTLTSITNLRTFQNLNYFLDFNETARNITFIFSTIDGSVHTLTLNATRFDMWGNQSVCSDKITTSSGTLICHIPSSYGNVSFKFVVYSYSDREIITQGTGRITPDRSDIFGGAGIIFLLIMMITIPMMMITSTIGVVIGAIIGLVAAFLLMIYTGGALIASGSAIMFLVIAGVILIWKIAERSKT